MKRVGVQMVVNWPITFTARGTQLSVSLGDVELAAIHEVMHMQPGQAAGRGEIREAEVEHLPAMPLYGDLADGVFDVRDIGVFSDVYATGAIDEGSTRFEVEQVSERTKAYLKVGDKIIIGAGSEAGQGQRGTAGVGGTWPRKAYPDKAAMDADTEQENNLFAFTEDDGQVYQWNGSDEWRRQGRYYTEIVVPRGLQGRVVAIAPDWSWIELDEPAQAAATDARLVQDAQDKIQPFTKMNGLRGQFMDAYTLVFQEGSYAMGWQLELNGTDDWHVRGAGREKTRIYSPDGIRSMTLYINGSQNVEVSDFWMQGNARAHGYACAWSETRQPRGHSYPNGVLYRQSHGGRAHDLIVSDVFQKAVGTERSNDVWADRVDCIMADGLFSYVQWMFQWADAKGGGARDCRILSRTMVAGFECFKGQNVSFIDCYGLNASSAVNTGGGFVFKNVTLEIEENSGSRGFSFRNPLLNINVNVGDLPYVKDGGLLENVHFIQHGPIDEEGNVLCGVTTTPSFENIRVIGGGFSAPDGGGKALELKGRNHLIDGFEATNRSVLNISISDGTIRNTVASVIQVGPDVIVENVRTPDGGEPEVRRRD
ncbi:MAG: hypothetical protein WD534_08665 [Phycisphaeraceae bacterium]